MESQIRTFMNYLRVEKGLADNTIYAYRRDIAKFAEFANGCGLGIRDVSRDDIVNFLGSLYRQRLDSR